ncbi:FtsB family cell division protein [Nocardioides sp.]|uniref:FtsB family cell division protein n=1 Tax=Nocardioides sp. TaxID=35761 RepID=UPI0039E36BB9
MADQRRSAPRSGGGPRGPGRRTTSARRVAEARAAAAAAAERLQAINPASNPKLTGRAVVLVLVIAVLVLSFASSLQAYLQQRHNIDSLKATISKREAAIEALQQEKDRWNDPAYVEQQARVDAGYVMPGETLYVALDAQGHQIGAGGALSEPDTADEQTKQPWWSTVWTSVELAGDPPAESTTASVKKIDGTKE